METTFDPENITGLSDEEAAAILKNEGYNELPSQKKQSPFSIFLNVLKEPMLLLLLIAGTIYLFLGEVRDALILLVFVFVVVGITFNQEIKTERALEALKNLSSPRALVIRNGEQKRIPGREVVKGDIIILREGDRIPADGVVLSSTNLLVDESLLTGESLAVRKCEFAGLTHSLKPEQPGGDDLPFVYSGTLVIQGHGVSQVRETGIHTEMGKIGKALGTIAEEDSLLKKETAQIIKTFAVFGGILCAVVVVVYGLTRGDWLHGLLAGLSLSMALLPEEFSVVLLIFLSMGAWRLSKRNVLVRRMPAIETLGASTVLCVDKTGTLTLNRMILNSLFSKGEYCELEKNKCLLEKFHELLEFGYLASQRDPFDPLEKEIKRNTEKFLINTEHIHEEWKTVREYPLSKNLLALSNVWKSPDSGQYVIATKGAPEAIFDLCHLSESEKEELSAHVQEMANRGLRLLGVAKASFQDDSLPEKQHDFEFEFIGLLGFVDPVRQSVAQSIKECYKAGIRVIMITGDYPGTAQHIARQIGLENPDKYITGPELANMDQQELAEKIKVTNIFARVVPEQKLTIVNALKQNGEVVAMTGDGVNDAPALKSAHIGIAMGERGTDVARESASIVLLNDDFFSIVAAVRLGRRIFDNLKKAIGYIFSVHMPIAGLALFPILFNLPLVLLPAHIAFLELIIDPACSTVFEAEPEEKNIMNRSPRNLQERLFGRKNLVLSLVQGISMLAGVIAVFLYALYMGKGEVDARTLTFATLVIANLTLIVANLSWSQSLIKTLSSENKALRYVLAGALSGLLLVLYVPALRSMFRFSLLHGDDLLIVFVVGILSIVWLRLLKSQINNNI
ncbi:HAD-IC family P-type ATPase [Methanosarcina sp. DH1]|uniref:cation-translocating P-type ATPase n=1 Tax=Methanosarcina sp. DH1 TaxID=2605695 RepID=UPI001E618064|nr:cation-translocating P-type ATPase [Methanosarcina sp. DH1]MCC4767454.1 HAD-IC family P-type ATPase [Methanosarcina sp. DH1]